MSPEIEGLRACDTILCSPYLRTLQTATLAFSPRGPSDTVTDSTTLPTIHLLPELGEHVMSSCDIGRPGAALLGDERVATAVQTFPSLAPQLKELSDGWWGSARPEHFPPGYHLPCTHREPTESMRARCVAAVQAIASYARRDAARPTVRTVAVVGHSSHFHELTGEWLDNCQPTEVEIIQTSPDDLYLRIVDLHE